MSRAVVVVATAAEKRPQTLGPVARQTVEELRREPEDNPRLGIRRGPLHGGASLAVYRTRLEPREGMPGLTVVYVYTPQPHPPAVAIMTITPDDPDDAENETPA